MVEPSLSKLARLMAARRAESHERCVFVDADKSGA